MLKLNHFAQLAALRSAHSTLHRQVLDSFLAGSEGDQDREKFVLKRLQFDTNPALFSKVEIVCTLMNCTKREFLEMAVIDAVDKAWAVFEDTYEEATGHAWTEEDGSADAQTDADQSQTNGQD